MISLAGTRQAAAEGGRYLAQALRLMVGQPDYDAYLAHHARVHPGRPAMSSSCGSGHGSSAASGTWSLAAKAVEATVDMIGLQVEVPAAQESAVSRAAACQS